MNSTEKTPTFIIRPGRESDIPDITELYNHYVKTSSATFDLDARTLENRLEWFSTFSETGPYRILVAEENGHVLGYAYSSQLRSKAAYDTSVECTVYVKSNSTGLGIGRALYTELFYQLANEKIHRVYANITVPNPESVRLHEAFGFKHIGTFTEVGYKFDKYHDTVWYELAL